MYEVLNMKTATVVKQMIQEALAYQGVTMVAVNIAYPNIDGDFPRRCVRRVNGNYDREAQKQLKYAKDTMYKDAVADYKFAMEKGYPFNTYELMQVYETTCNALPVFSLYYDVYQYTGGAHGITDRTGNTWDLYRCKMLEMKDLFTHGYDYTVPIFRYMEAEALRRQAAGEAQYFDGLSENLHKYFDEKNFYLSCQGLEVFYPLYSIAPYYVGIQVFTVPYGMFGNNLAYPLIAMCT